MAFTGHGHHIKGTILESRPKRVQRCGGPRMCSTCKSDVERFHKKLDDELSNHGEQIVPVKFGTNGEHVGYGHLSKDGTRLLINIALDPKGAEVMKDLLRDGLIMDFSVAPNIKAGNSPPRQKEG